MEDSLMRSSDENLSHNLPDSDHSQAHQHFDVQRNQDRLGPSLPQKHSTNPESVPGKPEMIQNGVCSVVASAQVPISENGDMPYESGYGNSVAGGLSGCQSVIPFASGQLRGCSNTKIDNANERFDLSGNGIVDGVPVCLNSVEVNGQHCGQNCDRTYTEFDRSDLCSRFQRDGNGRAEDADSRQSAILSDHRSSPCDATSLIVVSESRDQLAEARNGDIAQEDTPNVVLRRHSKIESDAERESKRSLMLDDATLRHHRAQMLATGVVDAIPMENSNEHSTVISELTSGVQATNSGTNLGSEEDHRDIELSLDAGSNSQCIGPHDETRHRVALDRDGIETEWDLDRHIRRSCDPQSENHRSPPPVPLRRSQISSSAVCNSGNARLGSSRFTVLNAAANCDEISCSTVAGSVDSTAVFDDSGSHDPISVGSVGKVTTSMVANGSDDSAVVATCRVDDGAASADDSSVSPAVLTVTDISQAVVDLFQTVDDKPETVVLHFPAALPLPTDSSASPLSYPLGGTSTVETAAHANQKPDFDSSSEGQMGSKNATHDSIAAEALSSGCSSRNPAEEQEESLNASSAQSTDTERNAEAASGGIAVTESADSSRFEESENSSARDSGATATAEGGGDVWELRLMSATGGRGAMPHHAGAHGGRNYEAGGAHSGGEGRGEDVATFPRPNRSVLRRGSGMY